MILQKLLFLFFCISVPQLGCTPAEAEVNFHPVSQKMCGLNFVAPPSPFPEDPMPPITEVGAGWIAVCPFAFTRPGSNTVRYNSEWQWWGEKPEGTRQTILHAHESGIRVMLKPHVYFPGSWPGDLHFTEEADWQNWEADYRNYILEFAHMAAELEVELFCVGVEFKKSVLEREAYWRGLIEEIREIFPGKLTYAANWDEYQTIPFWDALDYIGIDAYFPLHDAKTPSVRRLEKAWEPHLRAIRKLHQKTKKPVLFTEFGYLSVDGCAHNTWELEARIHSIPINEQAQANALDALFSTFWEEPWWAGGFLWKWFPNMQGHEGYPAKDYSPQGKTGEEVLQRWYTQDR